MKKYFTDAVSSLILSLKKQPPDTFLIPDGCFALLYDTRVKRSESRCKLACKRLFELLTRQKYE